VESAGLRNENNVNFLCNLLAAPSALNRYMRCVHYKRVLHMCALCAAARELLCAVLVYMYKCT
jgi:hypothetical protein